MALRTQDQGDSQVLYNNREWKVTMLRQAKTPAVLKAFFSGDWHQDLWHLGATRGMYGTSLCLELTYTWDQRGIPDSGQCPVEISSQRLIFRRLICGYYKWERRTIPRTTLATPSIGAIWTNAFLEMEGEQTCYLKTLTLLRQRGPTTRIIIMQVSSWKAKKVQIQKLRQWTTTWPR